MNTCSRIFHSGVFKGIIQNYRHPNSFDRYLAKGTFYEKPKEVMRKKRNKLKIFIARYILYGISQCLFTFLNETTLAINKVCTTGLFSDYEIKKTAVHLSVPFCNKVIINIKHFTTCSPLQINMNSKFHFVSNLIRDYWLDRLTPYKLAKLKTWFSLEKLNYN